MNPPARASGVIWTVIVTCPLGARRQRSKFENALSMVLLSYDRYRLLALAPQTEAVLEVAAWLSATRRRAARYVISIAAMHRFARVFLERAQLTSRALPFFGNTRSWRDRHARPDGSRRDWSMVGGAQGDRFTACAPTRAAAIKPADDGTRFETLAARASGPHDAVNGQSLAGDVLARGGAPRQTTRRDT